MEEGAHPTGTVSFLFTDVEGSTALWEAHPGAMRSALAMHDALMRRVLDEHGGYVFSTAGDAFCAAFAAPIAAVETALTLQRELRSITWPTPISIAVRMGLNTGNADERDGDYFGPTLNRAARIMGVASGGEVLASAATVELVRDLGLSGVQFVDLGVVELRGIGQQRLFGVAGPDTEAAFSSIGRERTGPTVRLPSLATTFIGRELEVVELCSALPACRLLTLVGPGGVGKTRLAIEAGWAAAEVFPDGVWLAELAPVRERDAVAHTLVAALELRPLPGRSPTEALIAGLRDQRRLIVVDNCEHLLGEVAALMGQLVQHCPTVRFLATSRAPLAVAGERVWPVGPLAPAGPAAALFVERAAASGRTLANGDAHAAIRALCERLDGMPLAIELAAARARAMTPAELLDRLGDRFRLLRSSRHDGNDRHATLHATVEWSYQLLDELAKTVFDRLGIFAAAVDLTGVVAVAGDESFDEFDVLDAVTTLVDHSLVVAEQDHDVTRYRLLDTMRAFARDRLDANGELGRLAVQHGKWAAGRVAQLNADLLDPDPVTAMAAVEDMERFWPDLRAAVNHALEGRDLDLVGRLLGTFSQEAMYRERVEVGPWLDMALELPGMRTHRLVCPMLGVAALLHWRAGQFDQMTALIELGARLRTEGMVDIGDMFAQAESIAYAVSGRLEEAYETNRQRLEHTAGEPQSFAYGFFAIAVVLWECYLGLAERAIETVRALPAFTNPILAAFKGWVRTTALLEIDPVAAIASGRETMVMARAAKASWMVDTVSNYLTAALARAGEPSEALELMRSVLVHASAGGGVQSLANTARNAIVLFTRLGRLHTAAQLAGWLHAQPITIPGTASMRTHAADAEKEVADRLSPEELAKASTAGAAMTAGLVVEFLLGEIEQASPALERVSGLRPDASI